MPGDDQGFTLVESLVALAILAMTAVALLGATEAHVARIGGLETRALAQLAAENRLAEIELGFDDDAVEAVLLGQTFRVAVERSETAEPDLTRLDLAVTDGEGTIVLRGFVGFVDSGPPP